MVLDDDWEVALTGPGSEVGTLIAAELHEVVGAGHSPSTVAANWSDPGEPDEVAQLTYAEVWVRSVT
jgi:hypothetical protein